MTSLTIVRTIAARPEIVFDALIEAEGMRGWWGPDDGPVLVAESEPRVGGRFRVRFRMRDGGEHEAGGEYLAIDRPGHVAMTWRWQGDEDEGGESRVDIRLRPVAAGTELTFVHARLSSDESRDGHREGWTGALDKLAAMFAGGTTSSNDRESGR